MWETVLAFVVWGCYGSVLTSAHIDPAITAIARSVAVGVVLTIFVRSPIPWRSGALWLSGAVLLVDEVLYTVSAVSGPVAIIGLAYGCVPVVVPVISSFPAARCQAAEPNALGISRPRVRGEPPDFSRAARCADCVQHRGTLRGVRGFALLRHAGCFCSAPGTGTWPVGGAQGARDRRGDSRCSFDARPARPRHVRVGGCGDGDAQVRRLER